MFRTSLGVIAATHLQSVVRADLAVYCQHDTFDDLNGIMGIEKYKDCDGFCTCHAFELLCLVREDSVFTLQSQSPEYESQCGFNCLCNAEEAIWESTSNITGDVPLPFPVIKPLPGYAEFVRLANKEDTETESYIFERNLLNELQNGNNRVAEEIIHPINNNVMNAGNGFVYSDTVLSIGSCSAAAAPAAVADVDQEGEETVPADEAEEGEEPAAEGEAVADADAEAEAEAEEQPELTEEEAQIAADEAAAALLLTPVICDLHYELDWNYYLRFESTCGEVEEKDPCFATFACVCSNGYYRIADKMPARPVDLDNGSELGEILKVADEQKQEAVEEKEEQAQKEAQANVVEPEEVTEESFFDSLDTWHYIVAGCALVALLVIIGLSCFCCCKKPKTVKPFPEDGAMESPKDLKDKKIEVGQIGALTQKKRKIKKKKGEKQVQDLEVTAPNAVGPTDDEASNLQIANPDSFIGNSSAQNFHKDAMGRNAAISPTYSSSNRNKVDESAKNPMLDTQEPNTQQPEAGQDSLGLPQINQQAAGTNAMSYTMSSFLKNPAQVLDAQSASAYSRHSRHGGFRDGDAQSNHGSARDMN